MQHNFQMADKIQFRLATAADITHSLPLLLSAGPQAFAYGFPNVAIDDPGFLGSAYADGAGFFGWQNHTVGLVDGVPVAISAGYDFASYLRLSVEHTLQVWRYCPRSFFVPMMKRGWQLRSLMPSPSMSMHYLANFGVAKALRGRGIGRAMLEYQRLVARRLGRQTMALDVSTENPRAQALYQRFGLTVTHQNTFAGPDGRVADTLRMEMPV